MLYLWQRHMKGGALVVMNNISAFANVPWSAKGNLWQGFCVQGYEIQESRYIAGIKIEF